MSLKRIVRLITPPILIRLARLVWPERNIFAEWEYVPDSWAYAKQHPEVKGWNTIDVLETYKQKWPQFVRMVQGTMPLGTAHESNLATYEDIYSHNAMMAFAYAVTLVAQQKAKLSMLDWGGGIGHYYLLAQAIIPSVEIDYHCKDVPLLSEYGAELFPQQHFYHNERCFERAYDFVMASTSLHYEEHWQTLLQRLASVTTNYLYIASTPTIKTAPSFVFVQRPYQYGYNTEYLGWCLNRNELLDVADRVGLQLKREFIYGYQPFIKNAPEQNTYRGYLFRVSGEQRS